MTGRRDPFEILCALNPARPADVAGEGSSARAQEALEKIVGDRDQPSPRVRRRRSPALKRRRKRYLVAVVALAAIAAAGAWALTQGTTTKLTIGCYASADLDARTVVIPASRASPTTACGHLWRRGDFGPSRVPRLQACVLRSGAVAVFPSRGGRVCQQLQLPPLGTRMQSAPNQAESPVSLKEALVEKFLAQPCISRGDAIALVRRELLKPPYKDWTVTVSGVFTAQRPCASLGFDEKQHRVLLVPMPRP